MVQPRRSVLSNLRYSSSFHNSVMQKVSSIWPNCIGFLIFWSFHLEFLKYYILIYLLPICILNYLLSEYDKLFEKINTLNTFDLHFFLLLLNTEVLKRNVMLGYPDSSWSRLIPDANSQNFKFVNFCISILSLSKKT